MKRIAIFGVPRSGTTWLSMLFNSHPDVLLRFQPLFSYGHKGKINENSTLNEINLFFDEILNSTDDFTMLRSSKQSYFPVFKKSTHPTHLLFKETRYLNIVENLISKDRSVKIIGIIRNPLAVINSWMNAPSEFDSSWNIQDEWEYANKKNGSRPEEYFGFHQWKSAASNFLHLSQEFKSQFKLITYKDLKTNTLSTTEDVFNFCEIQPNNQVIDFIKLSGRLHDDNPYSVYRANANDDLWKNNLPNNIVSEIKSQLQGTALEFFL